MKDLGTAPGKVLWSYCEVRRSALNASRTFVVEHRRAGAQVRKETYEMQYRLVCTEREDVTNCVKGERFFYLCVRSDEDEEDCCEEEGWLGRVLNL